MMFRGSANITFIGFVERVEGDLSNIKILSRYRDGLHGIEAFSHLIVLFWLHKRDTEADRGTLRVVPRRHEGAPEVGVFASRSPSRPNPIGFSIVELIQIKEDELLVAGLDAVEKTPIIDIKPYIPRADSIPNAIVPEWTNHGPKT
jgi:tRNA-Thr(GGU) m(6)t(6)A37 methyltransferase TsaA